MDKNWSIDAQGLMFAGNREVYQVEGPGRWTAASVTP